MHANKRVLIVFPNRANWATISTAVPILSGIAKKRGWSVDYFDTYNYEKTRDSTTDKETTGGFKPGFSLQENQQIPYDRLIPDLQKKIDDFKPTLLAVTCLSHEYEFFTSFFPKIRIPEETKVIIGGIHTTLSPETVLSSNFFDLVAVGEGERTFDEILLNIEHNRELRNIPGTFFVDKETGVVSNAGRRPLLSPEKTWSMEADFSFYDDAYFIRYFDGKRIRRFDLETARGCPYDCNYCGNSALKKAAQGLGKFIKTRPTDSTFAQIRELVDEYRIDIFQFMDECFLAHSKKWLNDFGKRYARECAKPFIFQTRAKTVNEEKIEILLGFGAPFQVSIGVESGSEKILRDVCNRKCTADQIIEAFDLLQKYHIRTNAFFMVGLPLETRADFFKSVTLCRRIRPSVYSVAIFQPLPGQALTKFCIEKGFITGKEPLPSFTEASLLKMPKPYLSAEDIVNLRRTFALYASLPEEYYPQIEKCEKEYETNKELFDKLVALRWEFYDYSKYREEIKLV